VSANCSSAKLGQSPASCRSFAERGRQANATCRKTGDGNAVDYLPCDQCFAYIKKRELWRHKCKLGKLPSGQVVKQTQLLLPAAAGTSAVLKELLRRVKHDDVKFTAKQLDC
jgi:hypothetical protein